VTLFEAGAELVCSGSLPCKKLRILSRKSCSSNAGGGASSAGGTGHGTGFGGGATGALAHAVSKSSGASVEVTDLTVFFLS